MLKHDFSLAALINSKLLLIFIGSLLLNPMGAWGQDKVDFATSIKPIFENHCLSCHGPDKAENFRIDDKENTMDYIEAGESDESSLYFSLTSDDEEELMPPPDENDPLSKSQIKLVKTWIDQGADWPDDVQLVVPVATKTTAQVETEANAENDGENDAENDAENDEAEPPAVDPKTQRAFNAIGSLHPAAIHLPIGLLLASGIFALFSLRGNFVMSDCAYYCLWLGTLGAIVACVTGYWASPMAGKGTVEVWNDMLDQNQPVFWHRTSAIVITALAFLLALFAAGARNRDPDDGVMWKLGLILLAGGIGWVGHEGGELTHGKMHYKDLEAIGAEMLPGLFGPEIEKRQPEAVEPRAVDEKEVAPVSVDET